MLTAWKAFFFGVMNILEKGLPQGEQVYTDMATLRNRLKSYFRKGKETELQQINEVPEMWIDR